MNVPSSTAAPMEHAFVMGGLRSAVENIKNTGKQGIPEPAPSTCSVLCRNANAC